MEALYYNSTACFQFAYNSVKSDFIYPDINSVKAKVKVDKQVSVVSNSVNRKGKTTSVLFSDLNFLF